jgi:hypothetical protein
VDDNTSRWFYNIKADKRGPVSTATIRELIAAGTVQRGTFIWCEGMSAWSPADAVDDFRQAFVAAPTPEQARQPIADNAVSTIIPYTNVPALIGYYVSVASLIPILGVLLAIAAIILGVNGLRYAKQNPQAKGTAHAVVAIVLGTLVLLGHLAAFVVLVIMKP